MRVFGDGDLIDGCRMTSQMLNDRGTDRRRGMWYSPVQRLTRETSQHLTTTECLSSNFTGSPMASSCVVLDVLLFPVETQEVSCLKD